MFFLGLWSLGRSKLLLVFGLGSGFFLASCWMLGVCGLKVEKVEKVETFAFGSLG